ncbi:cation:dicarboxylate symporter family transporter [Pseudomonas segetis]|uniref:Aerobic C4-dicarboxylate transport protein n=1 Tax=Pseudomonas segetis TaxID=298908 RepID=A0A239DX32_9PSED|nr:cation:dicarboxylase symporter family transporter [Pseudomonas segetis]SNS36174.1 aerobic C4-dicarboxylate transport protein [Pseudomonas segetis]
MFRVVRSGLAQLVLAVVLGSLLGVWKPSLAIEMKAFSDLFIAVVRLITPIVMFVLIASSVAGLRGYGASLKLGLSTVGFWQLMSLLSLLCGLSVTLFLQPGVDMPMAEQGFIYRPATVDLVSIEHIPSLLATAFGHSIIFKVLLAALVAGLLLGLLGNKAIRLRQMLDDSVGLVFRVMRFIIRFAPLAAFGAIAFTISAYGTAATIPLAKFIATAYTASLLYILVVLAFALGLSGVSLWRLLGYIKEELFLVASTGSSVAALPRLIDKLEAAGCNSKLARLTLTTGYSFNLNGSNIYLMVAVIFLAQSVHIELTPQLLLSIFLVCLLTSLSATSVAGSAFITLTATLSVLQILPLESIGILIGVERMMKCRSLTNVLGNCVACLTLASWNNELDRQKLAQALG